VLAAVKRGHKNGFRTQKTNIGKRRTSPRKPQEPLKKKESAEREGGRKSRVLKGGNHLRLFLNFASEKKNSPLLWWGETSSERQILRTSKCQLVQESF